MQNVAAISKGVLRKGAETHHIPFYEREPLTRLRRYIETTDWEKSRFLNKDLDNLCRYLLAAAFLCFLSPVALMMVK